MWKQIIVSTDLITQEDYFSPGNDNYPINDGCIYDDQDMSGVPSGYSPIKNKQFFKG